MNKTEMEGTMDKSCLDCKYAGWNIHSNIGYCWWKPRPPLPVWVNPTEYKADIDEKQSYVDCPAWEGEAKG